MCSSYFILKYMGPERKAARSGPFAALLDDALAEERPQIRPTEQAPVIAGTADEPVLLRPRWGLIPHWAKDPSIARHTFNARAETVAEKPAFRDAFRRSRCLVPASGWHEWTGPKGRRTRRAIVGTGAVVVFAGLTARWRDPAGDWVSSYTLLTVPPTPALLPIHDRMPLVLPEADWSLWLGGTPAEASTLLRTPELAFEVSPGPDPD